MVKDIISSIFLLCVGMIYPILSVSYYAGSLANPQSGFLPRIVGLIIVCFSSILLISSLRDRKKRDKINSLWNGLDNGLDKEASLSALMAVGSLIALMD